MILIHNIYKSLRYKTSIIGTVLMLSIPMLSFESPYQGYSNNDITIGNTNNIISVPKPDFANIENTNLKKQIFIAYILRSINNANDNIHSQHKELKKIKYSFKKNKKITPTETKKFNDYLKYYKIYKSKDTDALFDELLTRIGTIPASITLAQAIIESGWGTSRFAREHNNYYGLHCFEVGCGIKAADANVYLEEFSNVTQSTLGYYKMLNTGSSFTKFRDLRKNNKYTLSQIVDTLNTYSELESTQYSSRLISIIDQNNLTKYDSPKQTTLIVE